jgi:hypothetical protein
MAELTFPREGSATPAASTIEEVRMWRREGLLVMGFSDLRV